ncbi:MAG: L,D-transpeptidase [Gammaproteobacteria bacterium]|nr:L,D-transpeptidase [Gammaproteobacteria bacterium]
MRNLKTSMSVLALTWIALSLSSCASMDNGGYSARNNSALMSGFGSYESRLPQSINTNGRKTILIDPNVHAWGAYGADGRLVRAGIATAGGNWCPDIGRSCRTASGTFSIQSLGGPECKSSLYPRPNGGAPMPYCMFFHGSQGLHGSVPVAVVEDNVSHGCVRTQISDAEWIRYNFANVGTRVIVRPY